MKNVILICKQTVFSSYHEVNETPSYDKSLNAHNDLRKYDCTLKNYCYNRSQYPKPNIHLSVNIILMMFNATFPLSRFIVQLISRVVQI